eukprot:CAMPEP_0206186684 /NCGR_PEP_ID=MMETSP0166-20121206/2548_1 /ASSEMBLY_ACC=CAM_ASM_000260 /TAXON_ID=95228 /ORGANISM="Vannella robusta, Strain DIVA3 518/3/11/1/6" /LENGTH=194 /DNA_ID=CAMNT_0053602113 /DNA_START=1048 /DNA_END=1632 /DNA_ORIENTATION=-
MGKDKFENEELIKYGLPTDLWFHVDNLSSAHVYLRVPDGASLDNIPANVLEECCQIVKDNSIKGKKEAKVDIVYTPWENLLKKQSMEVGQVGFKKQKRVTTVTTHKNNTIVRNLNRTKREEQPDLVAQRYAYDEAQRKKLEAEKREMKQRKKQEAKEAKQRQELQSYSDLMTYDDMSSNKNLSMTEEDYEESFM